MCDTNTLLTLNILSRLSLDDIVACSGCCVWFYTICKPLITWSAAAYILCDPIVGLGGTETYSLLIGRHLHHIHCKQISENIFPYNFAGLELQLMEVVTDWDSAFHTTNSFPQKISRKGYPTIVSDTVAGMDGRNSFGLGIIAETNNYRPDAIAIRGIKELATTCSEYCKLMPRLNHGELFEMIMCQLSYVLRREHFIHHLMVTADDWLLPEFNTLLDEDNAWPDIFMCRLAAGLE